MANLSNLKEAIAITLAAEPELAAVLNIGDNDIATNQPIVAIAEAMPDTPSTIPYVGFSIPETKPLTQDDPTVGGFKSKVLLTPVSHSSTTTTYIGDLLSRYIGARPVGESADWYYDFTTSCLLNRHTRLISRYKLTPRRNNHEVDTFSEILEIEILWFDCMCDDTLCEDVPSDCPVNTGSDQFEIEDCD
jgi:hypothetical protein